MIPMVQNHFENQFSVVLGSTGSLGINIVNQLADTGTNVVAVARNVEKAKALFSQPNVKIFHANLLSKEEVRQAIVGSSVVYHCGGVPYQQWLHDFPIMNQNIIDAVEEANAVLVYADNLYMYGRMQGDKIDETHATPDNTKKGTLRNQLAKEMLKLHNSGHIKAVIARSADFYGPNVINGFTEPLFRNPLKGKNAAWIFDADKLHSLIYIGDMAKAMIMLANNPDTYGKIWHIPGDTAITGRNFVSLIQTALGRPIKLDVLKPISIKILGIFVPILRELKELAFEWQYPFVIDGSQFQNRFPEYESTSHQQAISKTLTWFQNNTA